MKKFFLVLSCSFLLSFSTTMAQNDMFKALFMYNFTKNIEWPTSYQNGDFIIGVLGNSFVIDELKRIAQKKKTGNQSIVVKKYSNVSSIGKCHIIYIPENKSQNINAVITKVKSQNTLIITDNPGMLNKGSCINYILVNGDQKFEISKQNLEKKGLKVSSFLTSLAANK